MKTNYQLMTDTILEKIGREGKTPRLLLHVCCAPCSSYVLEYLAPHFLITVLYYNPNISPREEYDTRAAEERRLVYEMGLADRVEIRVADYAPDEYADAVRGLEDAEEGGARCLACYRLRLERAAREAAAGGYDYFTTTLSISPQKNAGALNRIGGELAATYGVPYLFSDFKKKDGYLRSCRLSAAHHLYRQNYCGCVYSLLAARRRESGEADREKGEKEND